MKEDTKQQYLVSMYNLETGKRASIPRLMKAKHSGEAIEEFKKYMERIGEKTDGYMVMAEEFNPY